MLAEKLLCSLLQGWANSLEKEIDQINETLQSSLPLKRMIKRTYTGSYPIFLAHFDSDYTHWKEEPGDYEIVSGLLHLLVEINDAINAMTVIE